jgi:hypothetical protein
MIPVDIGPHPDAPNHYIVFGKPKDWKEEDCSVLATRHVGVTGDVLYEPAVRVVRSPLPSGEDVYPAFLSEWRPTEEELHRLNKGEPLRLLVSGNGIPPVAMWVREEDEV